MMKPITNEQSPPLNPESLRNLGANWRAAKKESFRDRLIERRQYIEEYGEDMPEIRN